jgi:YbbR domain-containing protein
MRTIFGIVFSNLLFKIFAIILAISVWIIAQLIRTQTANIVVPIQIANLPSDLVITEINTDNVKVTLQGRGSDFLRFLMHPPVYRLDLALAKPGHNRIKLAPDELVVSAPVLLKSIAPEYSEIAIDQLENKQVVVAVPHRIEPQKGIYITDISTQDTVILFGPEQEIKFIKEIASDSLFVSDYSSSQITRKLRVALPDTKYYRVLPESITVVATIEKESTRIFVDVPVNILSSNQQIVTTKSNTATITLRGAKTKMDSLTVTDIKVNINTLKLNIGEHKIPAEISLSKGIFLVRCEPKLFEVKIR